MSFIFLFTSSHKLPFHYTPFPNTCSLFHMEMEVRFPYLEFICKKYFKNVKKFYTYSYNIKIYQLVITCLLCIDNHILEVVRACFIEHNTLINEEFSYYLIISLIEPSLNRSLIFLCLIAKDLYSDGAIDGDGFEFCTLCDFHMDLNASLGHDDPPVLCLIPINVSCYCWYCFVAFEARIAT